MQKIYKKARAKVNLNLLILGKRKDNYHNIKSVFQKINLYDEIYIKKIPENRLELESNVEELNNDSNIICKAYEKMQEVCKNITGVKVVLNKRIPMQAGLAGGSTDCASFLIGMNELFELNLSKEKIEEIGKSIGADVVPCLYNKAILAEGIGDEITKIDTKFKYYFVIIKPEFSCDTKKMYEKIDSSDSNFIQIDNTNDLIDGLQKNKVKDIAENLYNVFENVVESILDEVKKEMKENGALNCIMTGSGSCVYGIFSNKIEAKIAYENMKEKYETYICTSYNSKREDLF